MGRNGPQGHPGKPGAPGPQGPTGNDGLVVSIHYYSGTNITLPEKSTVK